MNTIKTAIEKLAQEADMRRQKELDAIRTFAAKTLLIDIKQLFNRSCDPSDHSAYRFVFANMNVCDVMRWIVDSLLKVGETHSDSIFNFAEDESFRLVTVAAYANSLCSSDGSVKGIQYGIERIQSLESNPITTECVASFVRNYEQWSIEDAMVQASDRRARELHESHNRIMAEEVEREILSNARYDARNLFSFAERHFVDDRSVYTKEFERFLTEVVCDTKWCLQRPMFLYEYTSNRLVLEAAIDLHRSSINPNPPFFTKLRKAILDGNFDVFKRQQSLPA